MSYVAKRRSESFLIIVLISTAMYLFVDATPWKWGLVIWQIIAIQFFFLWVVAYNEIGHVLWNGRPGNVILGPGIYHFVNVPFLRIIDLPLFYHVVLERTADLGSVAGNPNIEVRFNQSKPMTVVNVQTDSFLKANLNQVFNDMKGVFSLRDKEGRVRYNVVGFWLSLLGWIVALLHVGYMHVSGFTKVGMQSVSEFVTGQVTAQPPMPVFVQIKSGRQIPPPPVELFHTVRLGEQEVFTISGIIFHRYKQDAHLILADQRAIHCALIPPGESLLIETAFPPLDAFNMKSTVTVVRGSTMVPEDVWEKVLWSFYNARVVSRDWRYLHDHWSTVDAQAYGIKVSALSSFRMPEPKAGGIVCF